MNEYTELQRLRADVEGPTPTELDRAFVRLNNAMEQAAPAHAPGTPPAGAPADTAPPVPASSHVGNRGNRARRRVAWGLGGVGGAIALSLAGGNIAMAVNSAQTSELLRDIAGVTVSFADPAPGTGEYLLSRTHANWGSIVADESDPGSAEYAPNTQQIDVYMPVDPTDDWVLVRDWGTLEAVTAPEGSGVHMERIAAPYGAFYAGTGDVNSGTDATPEDGWLGVDLTEIPTTSGEAAYAWIDAQYQGGSNSRSEDNFDRITGVLRSGLVPAAQRAALFEALALVPGVSSTANVANLNGVLGVAFGRTEALRSGERMEIIVDPETGLVIGERDLAGLAIFGFGRGDVVSSTAIETSVVSSAP